MNYPLLLRLTGRMDRGRLCGALNTVAARHEALRTTYERRRGRLLQLIHQPAWVDLIDASTAGGIDSEIATPIDMRAEIMRCTLWAESSDDYLLCVNVHHLSTDAISTQVIVDELWALLSGQDLPRVAWQFRHAAEWRRRHRAADNEAHAYWSRQLAGAMPLPLSPPNGAGGLDGSNATVPVSLAPQRVAQLRNYAQDHQATLFAVLLAAYCVALARQFGIADVAVASPFANRPRAEMLRTIGLFANLVILRVREANSLDRAVEQTVQILREAHAHEQFSHTQLHGTSGLEDAVFQLLPALPAARDCAGLTMRVLPPRVASRFPLEMTLIEDGGRISGQLQFASDRLDAARARDIATTFESVAQQVAAK